MPACSGVQLPLRSLHARHAVTEFIQLSLPPRENGVTWSRVSFEIGNMSAQYAQIWRSRWNSSRLLSGGTWLKAFSAIALPLMAMMLAAEMLERVPVRRFMPP